MNRILSWRPASSTTGSWKTWSTGERSKKQKGITGRQHNVLLDVSHGELHRFRIALDVVFAQHRNPDANRLRFLSQTGLNGTGPGIKATFAGGVSPRQVGAEPPMTGRWLISTPENPR